MNGILWSIWMRLGGNGAPRDERGACAPPAALPGEAPLEQPEVTSAAEVPPCAGPPTSDIGEATARAAADGTRAEKELQRLRAKFPMAAAFEAACAAVEAFRAEFPITFAEFENARATAVRSRVIDARERFKRAGAAEDP